MISSNEESQKVQSFCPSLTLLSLISKYPLTPDVTPNLNFLSRRRFLLCSLLPCCCFPLKTTTTLFSLSIYPTILTSLPSSFVSSHIRKRGLDYLIVTLTPPPPQPASVSQVSLAANCLPHFLFCQSGAQSGPASAAVAYNEGKI